MTDKPRMISRKHNASELNYASIENAIAFLQALPDDIRAGRLVIDAYDEYGVASCSVYVSYESPETPAEEQVRAAQEASWKARRLKEFEDLKKEFEP